MVLNLLLRSSSVQHSERVALLKQKGLTLWFTGLSASGKSTIACALEQRLLHMHKFAYRLDGDNIRHGLNKDLGFDHQSHAENVRRIGEVSKLFADAAYIAITAFIAPFQADRAIVRDLHEKAGLGFVEIFIDTPLSVTEERDPKGLYKLARSGVIKDFTGIDSPYEAPEHPDIHIKTVECPVPQAVETIMKYLEDGKYI
ncbi:adenylylsulfate kinase [Hygrophoropsis aurantiaca]|uniref:Adenylylsulfate kinase n=1 Tax=Hygrophoropsis aurantiaca TaxID=72124 RepID=A0ACB8AHN7_9AGAM|nr:adenylylsulfate kinase [Hygrophoropsis aurantiaca]